MDAGRLSYKNSPLRMFSTPRKWKATDPEGIENNAQNEYKEPSYAQLYGTSSADTHRLISSHQSPLSRDAAA